MRHEHKVDFLSMDEIHLQHQLQKLLQEPNRARYLAVIDDVCNMEAWESIKKAFQYKRKGNKVIRTTRKRFVTERVDDRCFVHELPFPRQDESRNLFSKRAKPTTSLEKLGVEMVDKCGGLTLAIVVRSGYYYTKRAIMIG